MKRWITPLAVLLLAACSGGKDEESGPEATADFGPLQKAERPESVEAPEPAVPAPTEKPAEGSGADVGGANAIPRAIRGRWALDVAHCTAGKGTDLTALTIDAASLRFYESHGELARIRESAADRLVADYRFSGEGETWRQRVELDLRDGGRTLVRRDHGEGATGEALRYTRCAA